MKSYLKLVKVNLLEMMRDKMQIFWFLLFPIIFVIIFGLLFSDIGGSGSNATTDPAKISFNVGLVGLQDSQEESTLLNCFEQSGIFKLSQGNLEEELKALKSGERHAVVVIPPNFEKKAGNGETQDVQLYYDAKHLEMLYAVSEVFDAMERMLKGRTRFVNMNFTSSLELARQADRKEGRSNAQLNQIDYLLPGLLGLTLMQLGMFGSLRILNLKNQGTLRALGNTPMSRTSFLVAEITVRLLLSLVQGAIIIVAGHYIFGVQIIGSWVSIALWIAVGTATFIALGYFLGTLVKTSESGNALLQVVQFPMMFLGGVFFPPELMPGFLRPVTRLIPLSYLADGLRSSMTGVVAQYGLTLDLLVLVGTLALCLALTVMRFKWE